jgi:hypothetical protein
LADQYGNIVEESTSGPSNPWVVGAGSGQDGFELTVKLLNELITSAIDKFKSNKQFIDNKDGVYALEAVVSV